MKRLFWNDDKNNWLRAERGIAFDDVAPQLERQDILADFAHPNPARYPGQRVFVVQVRDYVYLVPYVQFEDGIFLKTIIPSRKATRRYLRSTHG